jgi:acyl phosphate:glycerol-3-phosphate acyltransferase
MSLPGTLCFAGLCLGAYLLGSIPFGYLMGRLRGVDIRDAGSHNIGATNCWRLCGWQLGLPAFLLDVAKGLATTLTAGVVLDRCPLFDGMSSPVQYMLIIIAAVAVILGHVFPLYLHFRGGKAVATSLGVFLGIPAVLPLAGGAFALWVVVFLATRYVSVASTVAALGLLAGVLIFDIEGGLHIDFGSPWTVRWPLTTFTILLVAVVLVRHRENYRRLLTGTENRFGQSR